MFLVSMIACLILSPLMGILATGSRSLGVRISFTALGWAMAFVGGTAFGFFFGETLLYIIAMTFYTPA